MMTEIQELQGSLTGIRGILIKTGIRIRMWSWSATITMIIMSMKDDS